MKRLASWGLVLATGLLSGCLQVEDELTIQPDGSGTARVVTHATVPEEMAGMLSMSSRYGGGGGVMYPPLSEAEARQFFPAKDFTVKVQETSADDAKTITIEAAFKDINALLASPYGRAHQLALKVENGTLTLKAQSGGEAAARAAEIKPEGEMAAFPLPDLEDLQKKREQMTFKFRVALPNAVTDANGAREDKSVTWTAERAKCKDGEEFAAKLSGVLEARCAADGVKFTPVTPPRLGLRPFKDLLAGAAASTVALPDTNKIMAAARFVPYALQVTRALDLSGEGDASSSRAQLTGAVVLPAELAPPQWGEARLLEAVDAKGKSLKPAGDDDLESRMTRFGRYSRMGGEMDEDAEAGDTPRKSSEQRRMITLAFKSPDWKVKEIARIKGSLALQYLGASEVLKLSNAVPASLIVDASKRSSFSYSSSDGERGLLSDARLTELGLSLRVQMAMAQSGMTVLSLETSGGKTSLVDAQVFDADGQPWPTTLQASELGGEERSCQIVVAGRPKAPLSLGLVVSGIGATVEVPILVEKVPVGGM